MYRPTVFRSIVTNLATNRVFLGGKATGAWRWPPTPSSAEVKERVEVHFSPLWASVACSKVNFTFNFIGSNGRVNVCTLIFIPVHFQGCSWFRMRGFLVQLLTILSGVSKALEQTSAKSQFLLGAEALLDSVSRPRLVVV